LNASLKAGFDATSSERALIVLYPILASFAHAGTNPQRINANSRLPVSRLKRTTG
jgi:hypothetical protein